MPRLEFPDRPMTASEFRQIGKNIAGIQTYFFDESWHRTERVSVEAASEDEAWDLVNAGKVTFHSTVYEDECVETELVRDEKP